MKRSRSSRDDATSISCEPPSALCPRTADAADGLPPRPSVAGPPRGSVAATFDAAAGVPACPPRRRGPTHPLPAVGLARASCGPGRSASRARFPLPPGSHPNRKGRSCRVPSRSTPGLAPEDPRRPARGPRPRLRRPRLGPSPRRPSARRLPATPTLAPTAPPPCTGTRVTRHDTSGRARRRHTSSRTALASACPTVLVTAHGCPVALCTPIFGQGVDIPSARSERRGLPGVARS